MTGAEFRALYGRLRQQLPTGTGSPVNPIAVF
jgi:hypothetical protein